MILIGLMYLMALRGADNPNDGMHEKVKKLNFHITAWTLAGFGFFSWSTRGATFSWAAHC